jgi:hypothetical protein
MPRGMPSQGSSGTLIARSAERAHDSGHTPDLRECSLRGAHATGAGR